jgi:cholinesterase
VYRYLYAGNFTNISPKGWMGAYHSAEQPLVLGTHADFNGNSTELEWQTSYTMQDAWLAFISSPQSLAATQDWPLYTETEGGTVRGFGGQGIAARTINTRDMEKLCPPGFQPEK